MCKVTDFGESRSRATQTASIWHSATKNIQRESPAYMAPEIFVESKMSTAVTMEDLHVWAMGMVLFMLLNPNLKRPFSAELSLSHLPWGEVIKSKFRKKRNPLMTPSIRYIFQATDWFLIFEAYERCTCFILTKRPPTAEILEMFEIHRRELARIVYSLQQTMKEQLLKNFFCTKTNALREFL